jgi:competence protein ComGC
LHRIEIERGFCEMLILLLVLSIALLVAYSQIVLKWRMLGDEAEAADIQNVTMFAGMLKHLSASISLG